MLARNLTSVGLKLRLQDAQNGGALLASSIHFVPVRHYDAKQRNTIIKFVPTQEAYVVERFGKFHRILEPGFNFLWPFIEEIKYIQSMKELTIDIPKQSAVTADNVTINMDGVLFLKVNDPYKASYGVEDPEFACTQIAQTAMRAELGKMTLEQIFKERDSLNISIVQAINTVSADWGISCMRYEIRDFTFPSRIQEAMQMQVEAERKKRAAVLESEGLREADVNTAEGQKKAQILASEADLLGQINRAKGEAEALLIMAKARAAGLETLAHSLRKVDDSNAPSFMVADQYVNAFEKLAKTNNTLILSSNVGDISNLVGQAMSIYTNVSKSLSSLPTDNASPQSGLKESAATAASNISSIVDKRDNEEYYSDREEEGDNFKSKQPKSAASVD